MSDLNEVTEAMNARYMAKRLGLPQPGLFLTEDEVIHDVKARFDAKDARIAELEAEVARLRANELLLWKVVRAADERRERGAPDHIIWRQFDLARGELANGHFVTALAAPTDKVNVHVHQSDGSTVTYQVRRERSVEAPPDPKEPSE